MDNALTGSYGPNDGGYIHNHICEAATHLKRSQELYSQGHYPHSNALSIPEGHALRKAMETLAELDRYYAQYANKTPNEVLFTTYEPPYQDTIRWDKTERDTGVDNT